MNRISLSLAALLLASQLQGCAAPAPHAAAAPGAPADCTALAAEQQRNAQVRQEAEEKQQQAWKAVVPFAVLARYGQGKAAASQAQERENELRHQSASLGCDTPP